MSGPSRPEDNAFLGEDVGGDLDFFDYEHVEAPSRKIHFYNISWWYYYWGIWALVLLTFIGALTYTLVTPPKLDIIIESRSHQIMPVRGLFYPPQFEKMRQSQKNSFFQNISEYNHPHLMDEFVQVTSLGLLPIKNEAGKPPWQAYSANPPERNRARQIVVIVREMGLSQKNTEQVINSFPPQTVLNFSPYTTDLNQWMAYTRGRGHEILITLPVEPHNIATSDSGPLQIAPTQLNSEKFQKVNALLGLTTGYIGFMASNDSPVLDYSDFTRNLFGNLGERGLVFVDSRIAGAKTLGLQRQARENEMPYRSMHWSLIGQFTYEELLLRLQILENTILGRNSPTVIQISDHNLTLEVFLTWFQEKAQSQGIQMVPLSHIL